VVAPEIPRVSFVRVSDTHRLVPTRYEESVLTKIADSNDDLAAIYELDDATNDRLLAETGKSRLAIDVHELIFGVPYYRIVNAAFTHPHPNGSRFNGPDRGAWYAGVEIETAQDEVAYHHTVMLAEIDCFEDDVTYRDYLADVSANLHDIRGDADFRACLDPASYKSSQDLARELFARDAIGIIYPSVRHAGGTCIVSFRPTVVSNVREGTLCRFIWSGAPEPAISRP
jgi:RES domain-containing protein